MLNEDTAATLSFGITALEREIIDQVKYQAMEAKLTLDNTDVIRLAIKMVANLTAQEIKLYF